MTPRQGGWRSARHAPVPQLPAEPQPGPQASGRRGSSAARATGAARVVRSAAAAASSPAGRWSVAFVGVLAYIYAAVTYGLPIVGPAIVIALLGLFFERTRMVFPMFLGLFALYVAWAAAGASSSVDVKTSVDETVVLAKVLLIAFVIVNVIRDGWRLRTFMIFFLACFAAYPTRGTLVNYFIAGYTWFGRALWNFIYSNSNDLAALTFFPLSLAVGLALTEKPGRIKQLSFIGVGVLPLVILLTQSRGALIALVATGLLFFLLHARGKRLRSILAAGALAIVIIPFVPDSAWQRFRGMENLTSTETLVVADPEGSAEARYNIWRVARVIISENMASGIGLGAYAQAHASYAPRVPEIPLAAQGRRDTHSTYLNTAAETGIPGLLLFLAMIGTVVFSCEQVRRRAKGTPRAEQILALELGLLAFLLAGIFGSFAKLSFLYIQLAVMWALADVTRRELAQAPAQPTQAPVRGTAPPSRRRIAAG